jgi:hypothetical protein
LRSLGWDLTILGGQAKTPIVASIVYERNNALEVQETFGQKPGLIFVIKNCVVKKD